MILAASKNKEGARQFLSFIKSEKVGAILSVYGFDVQDRPSK